MNRFDIINRIGDKYRVGNTETGEFSYAQALKTVGKDIKDYQKATTGTQHKFLDIRFENERLVVLVECKNKFSRWDKAKIQGQLQDYVRFEKAYSDKKIVAILAETDGDEVWVWFGQSVIIDDEHRMEEETVLRTFEEYENLCFGRVNDKIKVVDSIKTLNEKLHSDGINEKLRSQFVGTCLLALKNGLVYKNVKETLDPKTGKKLAPERVVLKSIKDILEGLLTRGGSLNKAGKLAVLNSKVLDDQDVTSLTYKELEDILQFIDDNVVPYINDKSTAGQDLLNLFFTTFNKYVGKSDKNQAFTPDHICDFMSKAVGVNKNSRVLDPCCGSGAFLVRAMTDAMDDCDTEQIIAALKAGRSFRVEAGAGSGKTYSLNRVIEWIQANKWKDYRRKKQNVICITYTNAAVDVIAERLSQDSFILPSTIHSFAWSAIKQYQSTLMSIIDNDESLTTTETDFSKVLEIRYTLGHRYVSQGVHYLHHNDVLKLFCTLLDNAKFRRVFSDNYPLILIDEYQDSYKPIITRFVNFFIAEGIGPQFGFFGDAWQTIYQSNNACGAIEHSNLVEIKKGSNFRSAPRIVNLLNEIRPDLPQQSAIDNFEGEVVVVTCDDFSGARRSDRTFKDDLPAEELKSRLYQLSECIKKNVPKDENIKILMITHKVLATQQGYEQLLAIIDDGLRDKQDPFLLFFMNTVEPIYEALSTSNMQLLFDTLGIRRYPITKKSEKMKWKEFEARLKKARDGKAIDVINTIVETKLVPVPSLVDGYYHLYFDAPDTIYGLDATIRDVLDLDYSQFRAAIEFLYPEAEFSTEHGVKGEEYDNVVFVISKGWNQYQFETYAPMITGRTPIPNGKQTSYERNRNLFYVCCSRPRKRLFFFVSVPIDASFRVFLDDLVGAENIYTYGQYLEAKQ